ncbi:MAG: tRNA 2-thiocytidine(32) synthetase TtcA [Acidobacteria bacterium]|nr:tRNA 2-thiocytidine(32) synthetase TtcA [Acidobacteriota bacterium]
MPSPLFVKLKRAVGKAIADFSLIREGDRVAVAVSGGKDSYSLLHVLGELRRRSPVRFELAAFNLDPGIPGYRWDTIRDYLVGRGFTVHTLHENHAAIIRDHQTPGSSACSFCARLRRGTLYTAIRREGFHTLALGHHLDDFIETLLLNLFYEGAIKAMSPNFVADCGDITVIRPLVYVPESDITRFAAECGFPLVYGCCPAAGRESRRKIVKRLIENLSAQNPSIRPNLLKALGRVRPRYLMAPGASGPDAAPDHPHEES